MSETCCVAAGSTRGGVSNQVCCASLVAGSLDVRLATFASWLLHSLCAVWRFIALQHTSHCVEGICQRLRASRCCGGVKLCVHATSNQRFTFIFSSVPICRSRMCLISMPMCRMSGASVQTQGTVHHFSFHQFTYCLDWFSVSASLH